MTPDERRATIAKGLYALDPIKALGFTISVSEPRPGSVVYRAIDDRLVVEFEFDFADYGSFFVRGKVLKAEDVAPLISDFLPIRYVARDHFRVKALPNNLVVLASIPFYLNSWVEALTQTASDLLKGQFERVRQLQVEYYLQFQCKAAGPSVLKALADELRSEPVHLTPDLIQRCARALEPLRAFGFSDQELVEPIPRRFLLRTTTDKVELNFLLDLAHQGEFSVIGRILEQSRLTGLLGDMLPLEEAIGSAASLDKQRQGVKLSSFPDHVATWSSALASAAPDILRLEGPRLRQLQFRQYENSECWRVPAEVLAELASELSKRRV